MLQPGSVVLDGRFKIVRRLGGGGMGQVYVAEQLAQGRKVALKILRRELSAQPGMEQRFKREAKLLSSVDHPAVVRVIDSGFAENLHYLVMELAEGETLEAAVARGPLPLARALPLLAQLADGLAAIHARGIIHRDLKPENVILSRGEPEQARLLDFGIAKLAEAPMEAGVSQVGIVLGTPEYLSPEQATGGRLDARSDVYAFGVLAFKTLSGKLPFLGPTPQKFMAQHLAAPPIPLAEALPALARHPAVCDAVMKCLEKDPSLRPQSARALADTLARLAVDAGAGSAPVDLPTPKGSLPYVPPERSSGTAAFGAQPAPAGSGTAAFGAASPAPLLVPARAAFTAPLQNGAKPQNLTLMLTDIVGFTARTSRQTREENARMLEEHDQLLLPVFKTHGGRVLQKRGDAFLVGFASPTQSVLCGMEVQDRLWRRNHVLAGRDPLEVRVAIHAGDVLVSKEGPVGEPVQVIAAVEEVARANDVTFTEAVNLAMNRAEVIAEECGAVRLPGRNDQLRLYRCKPEADGPPFGGRDLRRAPRARRGRALWMAGALALLGVGAGVVWPLAAVDSDVRRVRGLADEAKWDEAMAALDRVAKPEGSTAATQLALLRAAVLHAQRRHWDEWAVAKVAGADVVKEPRAVAALLEDAGREDDAGLRKLVAALPEPVVQARLSEGEPSVTATSWGALRTLDVSKRLEPGALVDGYLRALRSEECDVRKVAARRLGELGDARAVEQLAALEKTPKKKDPYLKLVEQNCGQDEAAVALRAVRRRAQR